MIRTRKSLESIDAPEENCAVTAAIVYSSVLPAPALETQLGRLFEGDCLDILSSIESETVDLAFADPPFNLAKEYASKINDSISEADYLDWCRKWSDELVRVIRPGGSLFLYNLPKWNLQLGAHVSKQLTFRHWIAVDIKYSLPVSGRLYPSHYSLLYFCKGPKPAVFHPDRLPIECCRHCGGEIKDYGGYKDKMNPKGVNIADVWTDIPPVRHSRYKTRNANELSLKLMDRVISMSSDVGSVVLDPFAGSGTTLVAAEALGRNWIGIELHCKDILNRFQHHEGDVDYLRELAERKNVLFTKDSLERRRKMGRSFSEKYQINADRVAEGEPFTLF